MSRGADGGRPVDSPYLTWAKGFAAAECNLAGSGVPRCAPSELGPVDPDAPLTEPNDYGWGPLVAAIAARYDVDGSAVVVAAGASMANHLAMATVLSPGDHVVVEHPVYDPLALVPRLWGATVSFVARRAEERYRLDLDAIEARLTPTTRLIVLSNLHNPSGALARDADVGALATLAAGRGIYVLIDEVYREWLHGIGSGDGVRAAATLSPWLISTSSVTKTFGLGGLRIGWVLAEPALAERMRRLMGLFDNISAHPSERLATRALERAATILGPRRALVTANRARLAAWVAATPAARWVQPAGGTVGWVNLGIGDTNAFVERLARDHGTSIVPGRFFGATDHVRIALGVDAATLERGLERLSDALRTPDRQ